MCHNLGKSAYAKVTAIVAPQYDGDLIISCTTLFDWGIHLNVGEGGGPVVLALNRWPGFFPRTQQPGEKRVAAALTVRNLVEAPDSYLIGSMTYGLTQGDYDAAIRALKAEELKPRIVLLPGSP